MKLSVTMISYEDYARKGKMSVAQFIDTCAGLGVDAVDILEYFWEDKEREIAEMPGLIKSKGLEIGAFCVGNNFVVPEAERERQIEYVKEGINTAARLGAKRLRIFGGSPDIPAGINRDERMDIVADCIKKCIDCARANDIILAVENHGGIPLASTEILELLERVDSPFLKLNFDIGNFLSYVDESPLEAAKKLYRYIDHIHVKDLMLIDGKYEACAAGEGIVPLKECIDFFNTQGFEGYASLEYEGWSRLESFEGVSRSIKYLKPLMKCDK